jgi:hypothetical protein
MRRELILKAFQATGVWPIDASPVLKRFNSRKKNAATALEIPHEGNGSSWRQLRKLFDAAVKGGGKVEQSRLGDALHSLQVNNDLLRHQNSLLEHAL